MALSVQLDRLIVGPASLSRQQLPEGHIDTIESCLSNYFSNREISQINGKEKIPFHFQMKEEGPTLCLKDRKILLAEEEELKPLEQIFRYYQHTGHFPRRVTPSQEEPLKREITKRAVLDVNRASVPGTNGKILAGMRIAEDTLSVTRNILFAIPPIGPDDPVVTHLGYYAGMFWTFFSFRELDGGRSELKQAQLIGDLEGQRRAKARLVSGSICSAASLAYLAGRVSDTFSAVSAADGFLNFANALFGVGSVLAMGTSLLGSYRCHSFSEKLNDYLENPKLNEVEKRRGVLQFLKDSISVTEEEKRKLAKEIEVAHPHLSLEKKQELLDQKVEDLTETKVKYLKRRTSNKSLKLILNQVDLLLAKLKDPTTEAEAIIESSLLIHAIQEDSKTKMALHFLGFVAALISFVGMLIMTFLTAGTLPFVLYGISGFLYLSMTVFNLVGMVLTQDSDAAKQIDVHPLVDLSR